MIDTHCHIDLDAFAEDRPAVLERMRRACVHAAVVIAYNPERWAESAELCERHGFLRRAVGLHPNDAARWSDELRSQLEMELSKGDAIAVGETGLDFYREHAEPAQQMEAFVTQIALARDFGLPIVIHQRQAEQDVLDALRPFGPLRGVMHCFSSDQAFMSACVELGLHLGVGGVATFPKSDTVRVALQTAPQNRIILETDAPFLAPQHVRGKRNEPAYIVDVAECLSALWELPVDEVARQTTCNAVELFGPRLEAARAAGARGLPCA
jgi:TatD DNase family protein